MNTRGQPLSEQVRAAARESGLGPTALGQAAKIAPSAACRFMRGERGLSLGGLDRVAAALGLAVSRRGKPGAPIGASRGSAGARFPPAAGRPRPGVESSGRGKGERRGDA